NLRPESVFNRDKRLVASDVANRLALDMPVLCECLFGDVGFLPASTVAIAVWDITCLAHGVSSVSSLIRNTVYPCGFTCLRVFNFSCVTIRRCTWSSS